MNIENIKTRILKEFEMQERKGLYGYTQKIMAYNSNRIEGSTLTSEQTASLFDTGTIVSNGVEVYRAKDIEEMNGHFKMFNEMLKTLDEPLSAKLIKKFHYQLKNGVFEDMANGYPVGEYKNRRNIVSDIKTANPKDVPSLMEDLINEYNSSNRTLEDIAKFHAKYEIIHPFQDGNGRTGRMIMLKQCLNEDIIPVIVKDESKPIYYKALHSASTDNDYEPLTNYFIKCQEEYFDLIKDFIGEDEMQTFSKNADLISKKKSNTKTPPQ